MKKEKIIHSVLRWLALSLIFSFALLPIFWIIKTSFSPKIEIFTFPPKLIFEPTLENYKLMVFGGGAFYGGGRTFIGEKFLLYYFNTIAVSLTSTLISLIIGIPAAYALVRFKFRNKDTLSFWILSTRMAPPLGVALPLYVLIMRLKLLDTRIALIVLYLTFNLGFVIWMMMGFFGGVPKEIEEAAVVDGCSQLGAFLRITLPLSLSGISATAIICFIFSWNEFLFALLTTGPHAKTAPVGLAALVTHTEIMWGPLCAGGVLVILPVIIFSILVQKNLIKALTFGAIKG